MFVYQPNLTLVLHLLVCLVVVWQPKDTRWCGIEMNISTSCESNLEFVDALYLVGSIALMVFGDYIWRWKMAMLFAQME
jgi:hypothetical protein